MFNAFPQVCRFFCEMLLREVNRLRLTDFVDVMREALPAGMTFDEAHLQVREKRPVAWQWLR